MLIADKWKSYELIDTGNGEKLERWGEYILRRPDPQIIWPMEKEWSLWKDPHAHYHRSNQGGGHWEHKKKMPQRWTIKYKDLSFYIKPTGFKHTGLFPEQAANWDWIIDKIKNANRPVKVLNLFAYTGGATVAAAYAGAEEVCHVDASKGMVTWAKENIQLSNLSHRKVRFIVDDVIKFVNREIRRGRKYDAIIMDPPSYGRGPSGEVWKIEDELYNLIQLCTNVLSDDPLFVLVNSYTSGFSPSVIENILKLSVGKKYKGNIYSGEIGLVATKTNLVLPCGIYGRWEK
ncbi:23S rRNA (cytosine1962-C5)-methyltransferase [Alkalithermobacter thermoalcaliphilus JW-YL-7 = DSM 7308]|uniref:23S rRNA (Cytosine1962-C5)-methyltransferase n=1 Tax=Alkalithermobacter thermoalcaliphilus JW-YL-7 = DSM 7308 TaxID=1121328 RepID=A0A150FSQ9_CLOPD|nr:S-adenosylmethionine-dependent methyltransferase [[Clostridium] paradoxum JW-YL-7 = DSM 7308]SHL18676.1 23S rRNA (cytosine1962-C5)-methyltransferase [[Clostridium] paradoxum JW-YL-7 = DSM 7308]